MKRIYKIAAAASIVAFLASCSEGPLVTKSPESVIPLPQEISVGEGYLNLTGVKIVCDSGVPECAEKQISAFAADLDAKVPGALFGPKMYFESDPSLAEEEYVIEVTEKKATVKASGLSGYVYAIQTIKQMLPSSIWGDKNSTPFVPGNPADKSVQPEQAQEAYSDWALPVMTIRDYPRFAYRGMHLDCSRHFFSIEEVYRYLDIMAAHKLNRFHWHLTDDQGWRIEMKKHPRIIERGAWREGTVIAKNWGSNDGIRYGGYYTQDELRQAVEYAAARGITIIPEIDLPGHMQSVLAAYPELGCTGGPYEVWTTWGVSKDVLCVGNEKVFEVLEDILDELVDIFPSEYIHIGGDECPKDSWKKCPKCQAKIKELGIKGDKKFTAEDYLQSYVMNRVEAYLNGKGRKIIGWDEILDGNISQTATIMSWRGTEGGIKAAQSGRNAIMTPGSYCYFDYFQAKERTKEPLAIGSHLPVSQVYSYEPFDPVMTPEQCKHILGVQANMWTEYIASDAHLEYMLLPRLSALSEVQWCQPERKDFGRFRNSLQNNMLPIYQAMGLNYGTHAFDGRMDADEKTPPVGW